MNLKLIDRPMRIYRTNAALPADEPSWLVASTVDRAALNQQLIRLSRRPPAITCSVSNTAARRRPRIVAQASTRVAIIGSRAIVMRNVTHATEQQPCSSKNADYRLHWMTPQGTAYIYDPRLGDLIHLSMRAVGCLDATARCSAATSARPAQAHRGEVLPGPFLECLSASPDPPIVGRC